MIFFKKKIFKLYKAELKDQSSNTETIDCDFRKIAFQDLEACSMCYEKNRLEKFEQRLRDGQECFAFLKDEKIVAYFWYAKSGFVPFVLGVDALVPENAGYIWDCRVSPTMQKKGLYTLGLKKLIAHYDYKETYIAVEKDNIVSEKGVLNAGFCFTKETHIFKMLELSFCFDRKNWVFGKYIELKDTKEL